MAEQVRYVQVPDYSAVMPDLTRASNDLKSGMDAAGEAANLHVEKYDRLKRAEELLHSIIADVNHIFRMMPIKQPERSAKQRPVASIRPKIVPTEDERILAARSHRALQSLQKNLSELKSELGKV
jgi:hypothetical protein